MLIQTDRRMPPIRSVALRALSVVKQLGRWYLSPVGLVLATLLCAALLAALLDITILSIFLLVIAIGAVLPWKLLRQRDEARASLRPLAELPSRVAELDAQVVLTPTFDDVDKTIGGFRKANRKPIRDVRERMVELQLEQSAHSRNLAYERNRASELAARVAELESIVSVMKSGGSTAGSDAASPSDALRP